MSQWLVNRVSGVLESRSSRRSFVQRTALAATALSVAPLDYVLRPVTAEAAICGCAGAACSCGALCCDGYTEFCCTINNGVNACPAGSFVGGWWKADGSIYCSGPRYYLDCMAECTKCTSGCGSGAFCAPGCDDTNCGCALGNCGNRHEGCTTFRYGQCHREIGCSGRITCRVASCTPPWLIDSTCSTSSATDDNTANHNVPCLERSPATWSAWSADSPAPIVGITGAPALATWAPDRLDTFVRGGDNTLYHRWTVDGDLTRSAWENLGAPPGGMTSSPAAVSWGLNRIDVFARGADTALWHTWWDGVRWSSWESRGGSLLSAPAVASWGSGRLDVFVIGTDHALWHIWWDAGTWSQFESRGGYCLADPAAVSWRRGRVDVFVIGADSSMYHDFWNGAGWRGWGRDFPGTFASGAAAASWAPGRIDLFLAAPDAGHQMAHVYYDGTRWNSEELGGALTAAPAAVSWAPQRIDTLALGNDGNLWHKWYG